MMASKAGKISGVSPWMGPGSSCAAPAVASLQLSNFGQLAVWSSRTQEKRWLYPSIIERIVVSIGHNTEKIHSFFSDFKTAFIFI